MFSGKFLSMSQEHSVDTLQSSRSFSQSAELSRLSADTLEFVVTFETAPFALLVQNKYHKGNVAWRKKNKKKKHNTVHEPLIPTQSPAAIIPLPAKCAQGQ